MNQSPSIKGSKFVLAKAFGFTQDNILNPTHYGKFTLPYFSQICLFAENMLENVRSKNANSYSIINQDRETETNKLHLLNFFVFTASIGIKKQSDYLFIYLCVQYSHNFESYFLQGFKIQEIHVVQLHNLGHVFQIKHLAKTGAHMYFLMEHTLLMQ